MYFQEIKDLCKQFIGLSIDEIAYKVATRQDFQQEVIRINTQLQLYDKGQDSEGTLLSAIGGSYSPVTIEIKRAKGQPFDRVTLKDTGDFYKSFRVIPFKGGFEITADPIKDNTNLFKEWGEDIIGIQDENKHLLAQKYVEAIFKKVEEIQNSL
jgi:hypothetical protein